MQTGRSTDSKRIMSKCYKYQMIIHRVHVLIKLKLILNILWTKKSTQGCLSFYRSFSTHFFLLIETTRMIDFAKSATVQYNIKRDC